MARPWADQPYRLLDIPGQPGAVTTENKYILDVAIEMANVHNLILRGMNAIYLQCEHVHDSADIKDFVQFIEFWGDTVHHHHHQEETLAFPEWNKIAKEGGATTDLMSENIEQHHAFEGGFQALLDYVKEVQDGKATYDGRKVTATLDSFCPVLNQHLHDEIKTIMGLEKYDGKKVKAVFAKVAEAAIKTADPNKVIPLAFGCVDRTAKGSENFPPVPFFLPYLSAYWFSRKHKGLWKFCPCDHFGRPRPLRFLGETQAP